MAQWIGKWTGGRKALQDGKVVYYLERNVGSRGNRRYFTKFLGPISEEHAHAELALFARDPDAYRTPEEVREHERQVKAAAEADRARTAIFVNTKLIVEFVSALRGGYGTNGPVSEHYAYTVHSYLSKWATSPVLKNRDLRLVPTHDLRRQLDEWGTSAKHRIVAIKALTAWLRWRGDLRLGDDPTMTLNVPQARRLTPAEKAKKVYRPEVLRAAYRHIPNQDVRDIFWVRMSTGLHFTEIARIVRGEAHIREVEAGEIVAVIDVTHKSGQEHRQSVDAPTLAILRRLIEGKTVPTEKTLARSLEAAAKASKHERLYIGHLRHTFTTLATEFGRLVTPNKTNGVALHVVGQIIGHHDTSTTRNFYYGTDIPPLVRLDLGLVHPDDPQPAPQPGVIRLRPKRQSGKAS